MFPVRIAKPQGEVHELEKTARLSFVGQRARFASCISPEYREGSKSYGEIMADAK
jgi:hypothetical protein